MPRPTKLYIAFVFIVMAISFTFCSKSDDTNDTNDPSNLKVELLSTNNETGYVVIQASAQNTNLFELYIGSADTPEEANITGYFEYTFAGQGNFEINIRAYGASGKYISVTKEITIAPEPEPVPLNRGYYSPLEYTGYSLVWQDDFSGTSVNSDYWSYDIGNGVGGWGNNELEYYRVENAMVGDSVLTIEARKEDFGGQEYTSAKLKTLGKKSFQYGRIDIRALLPQGKGLWPALWTLGNNLNTVGWPDCGEIDMMEMIGGNGGENTVYGTVHWEHEGEHAESGGNVALSSVPYNFAEAYHVFSIHWDENAIKWFVDNQQYFEIDITGSDMTEFHQPHWFIFNVAIGGNWPGNPNSSTLFPQQMKVDYIRVFQVE